MRDFKIEVLENIENLKAAVTDNKYLEDKHLLGYYNQMLQMQEFLLVEILAELPESSDECYFTNSYGWITPKSSKMIISLLGSIKSI
jgi:hypothetical protein